MRGSSREESSRQLPSRSCGGDAACNLRGAAPIQLPKPTPGVFMRFAVLLLSSVLAAPILSAQRAVPSGGQWLIEPGDHAGTIQLSVRYGERGNSSNWSRDVPLGEFVGLSA